MTIVECQRMVKLSRRRFCPLCRMPGELLTVVQAAALLAQVTRGTLRRWLSLKRAGSGSIGEMGRKPAREGGLPPHLPGLSHYQRAHGLKTSDGQHRVGHNSLFRES